MTPCAPTAYTSSAPLPHIPCRSSVVPLVACCQVGSAANPVAANVTAQIQIADSTINTSTDPSQFGHGLIGLGTVTMHGEVKNQTFVNLAVEPHAGDTTLTLSQAVSGWHVGDRVELPDTRQLPFSQQQATGGTYTPQDELLTLAGVSADGKTLTLSAPLQFDHLGARDGNGVLTFTPDVSDLTRNVLVRSANGHGTRGYALFTGQANVDIEYAEFVGLGRSTDALPDNTTYDSNGNVTHVGTNQMGRYPVTFAHLYGVQGGQANGYQYTFEGNSVFCPIEPATFRWGIDINDSHYGLIQDNVLYNWAGAGIVTESGNETGNVIAHNNVVDITGAGGRADARNWIVDIGFEGAGLWFRGFNNYVHDNVVSDAVFGYTYFAQGLGQVHIPLAPGDDTSVSGQYTLVDMTDTPILQCNNNTAYGAMQEGMTVWNLGTLNAYTPHPDAKASAISNFHAWNIYQEVYYGYQTVNLTLDGFVFRGDFNLLAQGESSVAGIFFSDYLTANLTVKNADIQGMAYGIVAPGDTVGTFTVQDSYLRSYLNISVGHPWLSGGPSTWLTDRTIVLNDIRFAQALASDVGILGPQYNIGMGDNYPYITNLDVLDQVLVYNYNGVAGDNFRLYYQSQAAGAVMPQTTYQASGATALDACPVAGLTNAQAWAQYGIATGGAVAPANTTTRPKIVGLIGPIS